MKSISSLVIFVALVLCSACAGDRTPATNAAAEAPAAVVSQRPNPIPTDEPPFQTPPVSMASAKTAEQYLRQAEEYMAHYEDKLKEGITYSWGNLGDNVLPEASDAADAVYREINSGRVKKGDAVKLQQDLEKLLDRLRTYLNRADPDRSDSNSWFVLLETEKKELEVRLKLVAR